MHHLLKYTYLMDVPKINQELTKHWNRYQEILDNPNWEDLNEARSILYFIRNIYCEDIASQAIQRRLSHLQFPLTFIEFLSMIDSNSPQLAQLRQDLLFLKLENFYLLIKNIKNKTIAGRYYWDEDKFLKLYNQYNPHKEFPLREQGLIEKGKV